MRARLVALDGQADIFLEGSLVLVGRHSSCDVRLESPRVSRRHCCLVPRSDSDEVEVRDLGSVNGTRINGVRVELGRLLPGDVLSIARCRFCLTVEYPSAVT